MDSQQDVVSAISRLELNGKRLREVASLLTERIKQLERALANTSGKVSARCVIWTMPSSVEPPTEHVLSFERKNKEWVLFTYTTVPCNSVPEGEIEKNRTLLRDAPVEEKIRALRRIPQLIEQMRRHQDSIIEDAIDATKQIDDLLPALDASKEGI